MIIIQENKALLENQPENRHKTFDAGLIFMHCHQIIADLSLI